jgi:hypothetical protein
LRTARCATPWRTNRHPRRAPSDPAGIFFPLLRKISRRADAFGRRLRKAGPDGGLLGGTRLATIARMGQLSIRGRSVPAATTTIVRASLVGVVMFLLSVSPALAKPEYSRRTRKDCAFCHPKGSWNLTEAGKYFRDHHYSLDGYKPAPSH